MAKINPGDTVRMMPNDFVYCRGVPAGAEGIVKETLPGLNIASVAFPGRRPSSFRFVDLEVIARGGKA